jgi:hypothetical protein
VTDKILVSVSIFNALASEVTDKILVTVSILTGQIFVLSIPSFQSTINLRYLPTVVFSIPSATDIFTQKLQSEYNQSPDGW